MSETSAGQASSAQPCVPGKLGKLGTLGKPGKPCFSYSVEGDVTATGSLAFGDLELLELGPDQVATITCEPAKSFDLGEGPGKKTVREVRGGTVGLILDARGRPLALPGERADCQATMERWTKATDMYTEVEAGEPVGV